MQAVSDCVKYSSELANGQSCRRNGAASVWAVQVTIDGIYLLER
jgi:hypothetical protein